jgi:hypothetical protein
LFLAYQFQLGMTQNKPSCTLTEQVSRNQKGDHRTKGRSDHCIYGALHHSEHKTGAGGEHDPRQHKYDHQHHDKHEQQWPQDPLRIDPGEQLQHLMMSVEPNQNTQDDGNEQDADSNAPRY